MIATMTPLSIEIRPRGDDRYKSISTLYWKDLPGFAIITGKNGAGKSQLLEVMASHLAGAPLPGYHNRQPPLDVTISGTRYEPDEIGYLPSGGRFSGGTPSSIANLRNLRQQTLQQARQGIAVHDITTAIKTRKIHKRFGGKNVHQMSERELSDILHDDFEFAIDDIDVTAGITHVFVAYRLKALEAIELGHPGIDRGGTPLGPAPWQIVNESLATAGFPYEVISPQQSTLLEDYTLRLKDRVNGAEIAAIDLSSGEKVLLQLVLWLFIARKDGLFPKLLLLDEPDAHLHPSMTTQFLDVISEVLVNRYGVRVIMTTHSPSTVALAPEGSVFQMERGVAEIAPVSVRADIISVLTAGLVTVSRATKFCVVEDQDDIEFYETVRDILMDHGPSRDPKALRPSPSLAFIAASIGEKATKVAGGCTVVPKLVAKFDTDALAATIFGIIDRDASNVSSGRIHVIGRYSFENYLLDPLVLFALLLEENQAPPVPGVNISAGNEHLLRFESETGLQAIVDVVSAKMTAINSSLQVVPTTVVRYTQGQNVQVPGWVINHRGHDLLPIAQQAFGGPKIVNPPRLIKAVRRCRLIPEELASLLATIQSRT